MADSSPQIFRITLQYPPPVKEMSELTKYLQAANDGPFVLHLQHQQGFKIRGFPVRILKSRKVYSGEWDWHSPPGLTLTLYIDEIKNTSLRLARKIARQTFEALNDDPSTPNEPLSLGKCQDLAALHKALLYKRYELYIPLQSPLSHPEVPSPAASILQSNDVFSGRARVSSKKPRPPRLIHEPSVPARLEGKIVSAFPDTGAAANFLNIRYARRHGFNAGNHTGESVKIGNGSLVEVLGTMTLPFSFAEESKVHQVEFKVLTNCIHDVVLGSPFLKLTQTLIRFKERIQRRVRKVFTHNRICSLGSHQYVDGQLNGFDVSAVPDTGADVSVMSASFAKRRGFHVDTSERNRTVLEFADRSSATTVGVVKDMEWKYDSSFADRGDRLDVYVLKGLAEDLILSYDFLSATDAFLKYEDDFWTNEGEGEDEDELVIGRFFIIFIKFASKVLKRSTASGTDSTTSLPNTNTHPPGPTIIWHHQKAEELHLYRKAKLEAQQLPDDQREAFLAPHLARWHRFLASRPAEPDASSAQRSSSSSSTSSSTSPGSSKRGGQVSAPSPSSSPPSNAPASPAKAPLLKGRSRFFGERLKLR